MVFLPVSFCPAPAGVRVVGFGVSPGSGRAPTLVSSVNPVHGRDRRCEVVHGRSGITRPVRIPLISRTKSLATAKRAQYSSLDIARLLRAATARKATAERACKATGRAVRLLPEGVSFRLFHGINLCPSLTEVATDAAFQSLYRRHSIVKQLEFPLMARLNGPSIVHPYYVIQCKTYREAVRMAWSMRRVHRMTLRQLAAEAGLRPQFVSDYLNADDKPKRRNLPPESVAAFEGVVGNSLLSQWHAHRALLTCIEEMQIKAMVAA